MKKTTKIYKDIPADYPLCLHGDCTMADESGEVTTVANAIREILKENQEQSKALKSFSTDLAMELNNGFDEVLSRQMQQKILPLMENVDATTKAIVEHIDQMASQAYRIGQEKDVFVYYPMAVSKDFKSFDETLDELLSRKTSLATSTIFPTERVEVKQEELGQLLFGV